MASADLAIIMRLVDEATAPLKRIEGAVTGLGAGFAKFGLAAQGVSTALDLTRHAVEGMIGPAMEAQKVQALTNAVLLSTKGAAGVSAEAISDYARSLSEMTAFDDEAIQSAENLLLTFTSIGRDIFPQTLEAVLDMSAALGQDLKSSSIQLGKALQDPINGVTALRRVGVALSESQQELIKHLVETGHKAEAQKIILKELETEFGGAAQAAGQTLGGSLTRLQTQFGNIAETMGGSVIAALEGVTEAAIILAKDFNDTLGQVIQGSADASEATAANFDGLREFMGKATTAIGRAVGVLVAQAAIWWGEFLDSIQGVAAGVGQFVPWVGEQFSNLGAAINGVIQGIVKAIGQWGGQLGLWLAQRGTDLKQFNEGAGSALASFGANLANVTQFTANFDNATAGASTALGGFGAKTMDIAGGSALGALGRAIQAGVEGWNSFEPAARKAAVAVIGTGEAAEEAGHKASRGAARFANAWDDAVRLQGKLKRELEQGYDELIWKAEQVGIETGNAINVAIGDAMDSIANAQRDAAQAIDDVMNRLAQARADAADKSAFEAGLSAEEKAFRQAQEDKELLYKHEQEAAEILAKAKEDMAKADTDGIADSVRKINERVASEQAALEKRFKAAKDDLAHRRQIDKEYEDFKKAQDERRAAFAAKLDDRDLQQTIARINREKAERIAAINDALGAKQQKIQEQAMKEIAAIISSLERQRERYQETWLDRIPALLEQGGEGMTDIIAAITADMDAALESFEDDAFRRLREIADAANITIPGPNSRPGPSPTRPVDPGVPAGYIADPNTIGNPIGQRWAYRAGSDVTDESNWIQYHRGGIVPGPLGQPVPVLALGGERFLGPQESAGAQVVNITVTLDGQVVGRATWDYLKNLNRIGAPMGLS